MFRRRKNGKPTGPWYFRHPVTGDRVSSKTTDKARAAQLLRDLENEAFDRKNGRYVPKWEEVAEKWLALNQTLSGIRSQQNYHDFWLERLRGMKLTEITDDVVHREIMAGRPVSLKERLPANSTANLYVMYVRKIIRFAGVSRPQFVKYPEPKTSRRWLRPEEWHAFVDELPEDLAQLCTFALATGLRINNVMNFRWAWLHDDKAFLPAAVTKTSEEYGIPLNKSATAIVRDLRAQTVRSPTHVFIHMGKPWAYRTLNKAIKRACKRAEIADISPHVLRHTFASWLTQQGVSDAIRRRLGCWQLGGGADTAYLHFDVEWLRPFAEKLDPLLTGGKHGEEDATLLQLR